MCGGGGSGEALAIVLHFDAMEGLGLGIENQGSRFLLVQSDLRVSCPAWAKSGALLHHHQLVWDY